MVTKATKIDEVAHDLDIISESIKSLLSEIQGSKRDFTKTQTELVDITENIKILSDLVKSGNDLYALIVRVSVIENSITEIRRVATDAETLAYEHDSQFVLLSHKVEEVIKKTEEYCRKVDALMVVDRDGKWKIWVAVVSGVFTLIGAIILLIVSYYK